MHRNRLTMRCVGSAPFTQQPRRRISSGASFVIFGSPLTASGMLESYQLMQPPRATSVAKPRQRLTPMFSWALGPTAIRDFDQHTESLERAASFGSEDEHIRRNRAAGSGARWTLARSGWLLGSRQSNGDFSRRLARRFSRSTINLLGAASSLTAKCTFPINFLYAPASPKALALSASALDARIRIPTE